MSDASEIDAFLATLLGIEQAWAALDDAQRLCDEDTAAARQAIEGAIALGGSSAQVLTRAAGLLSASDAIAAHGLLARAVSLNAPPAPAQIALARSFVAQGDAASASRWLRGGMLRARPDAALLLELATLEPAAAASIVTVAQRFACGNPQLAVDAGQRLLELGQERPARIAWDIAYGASARSDDFILAYNRLLADPDLIGDPPLPPGPLGMPHWWMVATMAAQVHLARATDYDDVLADVRARQLSSLWLDRASLARLLTARIAAREPFSWIRLGDGEARFLLHAHPALRIALPEREARAMAQHIWHVWFGQAIEAVPEGALAALASRLDDAIRNADVVGATSVERLVQDKVHAGFCAALERHLQSWLAERPEQMFSDALANIALNEIDPFYASLLSGLDFLGVVSPHPELADRLQRQLGIGTVASYNIPGEGRLARSHERRDRGAHFPGLFEDLLATLAVPRRGAVFLVAGGLLGKIYCDRIKALGGIALDIGAVADAWMGYNTRGTSLDASMRHQLVD